MTFVVAFGGVAFVTAVGLDPEESRGGAKDGWKRQLSALLITQRIIPIVPRIKISQIVYISAIFINFYLVANLVALKMLTSHGNTKLLRCRVNSYEQREKFHHK